MWEVAATVIAVGTLGAATWYHQYFTHMPWDYWTYAITANGDYSIFYYAYWAVPIFKLLGMLPFFWGYYLWGLTNIFGMFVAARIFGGKVPLALTSFQLLYVLYFGNIVGIIAGSLALFWLNAARRRWAWAGLALCAAFTKYQLGIMAGCILLMLAQLSWRERGKILSVVFAVGVMFSILYPGWIFQSLATIQNNPPNDFGSISLWRWVGPFALLLWVPPLAVSLPPLKRMLALLAAAALGVPYFQQTDLLLMFSLPLGWLPLLGNLGYLYLAFQWEALQVLTLVPALVYVGVFAERITKARHKLAAE